MEVRSTVTVALLFLPVVLIGGRTGLFASEDISFSPSEGTILKKTFQRRLSLALERGKYTSFLGDSEMVGRTLWTEDQTVVLIDKYGPVRNGQPLSLVRNFEQLKMSHIHALQIFGAALEVPRDGRGELEGVSVIFKWNEQEEEYDLAFDPDTELDASLLQGLEEDADLRGILPWEKKSVGDVWFTDVDIFRQLCWPGGAIPFLDDSGRYLVKPVDQRLAENLDGTFRVEFERIIKYKGVRYARLRFRGRLEAETTFDHDLVLTIDGVVLDYSELKLTANQQLELFIEATGWLDWDLDSEHLDSLQLEGDVSVKQTTTLAPAEVGSPFDYFFDDFKVSGEWSGRLNADVEFRRL